MRPVVPGLPLAPIKAYWWRKIKNFGDGLAPFLLDHFGDADLEWSPIADASIASIGSILEHIPPQWAGYVCGAGRLKENSPLNLTHATVLALRGPLSARGIKGNFALGDPGLLADELVGPQEKQWDLGIVPHWKDDELVARFTKLIRPPSTIRVISPRYHPLTVVAEIGACKRIVTSSLHGMIAADAFGIPRRVEISSALLNATEGGDFKFRDYSASINTPFEPGRMTQPSRWAIEDAKYQIFDAYKVLEKELHDL
jgi:pyruvyltransferase